MHAAARRGWINWATTLLASGADELVLDLCEVGFVFSPCVSRIVKLFGSARERGKSLRILISPRLRDLFEMAGLSDELSVEVVEPPA